MKKIFTLLFLIVFAGAGTLSARVLQLGVRASAGIRQYSLPITALEEAKIASAGTAWGYGAALVARISIPKFLSIQPELEYNLSHYGFRVYDVNQTRHCDVKVQRIELPVLLGVNIKAFRIFAGPSFRLATLKNGSASGLKANFKDASVAGVFGLGFDIHKFFLDVRYKTYFGSVRNNFIYDDYTVSTHSRGDDMWSLNIGFFF